MSGLSMGQKDLRMESNKIRWIETRILVILSGILKSFDNLSFAVEHF